MGPSMHPEHEARVQALARQVVARPAGSKLTIRKTTPTHSIRDQGYKAGLHAIDVGAINRILAIDVERRVASVEGQVTMGELCAATLAHGLLPAVVPEFRKFTVAGLINGEGIQSSAHRYGVFTHNVLAIELLLAGGRTITATPDQHADVFAALPESLGTLGIVTAADIRLVPAGPYVKCRYRRFTSLAEYVAAFGASLGQSDFHEGFVFGPQGYALVTGEFADTVDGCPIFDPDRSGGEYFYQHVRSAVVARADTTEAMTTLGYLSRLERGFWWMMDCQADFPLLSETEWGRQQMDAAGAAAYSRGGLTSQDLTTAERDRCLINQDMGVKLEGLREGIEWVQSRLAVTPLWNCAVRLPDAERARLGTAYVVDIGIYGEPQVSDYRNVRDMRALQRYVPAPSLWGVSYLTWDELTAVNPTRFARYERARAATGADAGFLHMKEKVTWVDPSAADRGKIPSWRLQRSYGRHWRWNPLVHLLLLVVWVSKLIWRKPAIAR